MCHRRAWLGRRVHTPPGRSRVAGWSRVLSVLESARSCRHKLAMRSSCCREPVVHSLGTSSPRIDRELTGPCTSQRVAASCGSLSLSPRSKKGGRKWTLGLETLGQVYFILLNFATDRQSRWTAGIDHGLLLRDVRPSFAGRFYFWAQSWIEPKMSPGFLIFFWFITFFY
jgi:hypothetical protein